MLADNDGMYAAGVNAAEGAELIDEAVRVQQGAGADDLLGREAGQVDGWVGKHINGVGRYYEDGVGSIAGYLGNDILKERVVGLEQADLGLTRLLVDSGGENNDRLLAATPYRV